jgi:acetoin utilization protein AcuC
MTTPLPAAAEDVLLALQWNHSRGRNPPEHWFKYLADSPHLGPVRDPVKAVVEDVLR